jgi:hypothetical protein
VGVRASSFRVKLPDFLNTGENSTIGFEYKESLIRPGRRLYILGEVHDTIGPLVIGKPEQQGHFIIAGRTEDELRPLAPRSTSSSRSGSSWRSSWGSRSSSLAPSANAPSCI